MVKNIAAIIFQNNKGEFLLYLRDNKAEIPFPNHWDLFGGHVEIGETIEEALIREVKEELNYDLKDFKFFKKYECLEGDGFPNIKYVYSGEMNVPIEKLILGEGERMQFFSKEEIPRLKIASIHKRILTEFMQSKFSS